MAQDATLHVKLDSETDEKLKRLAEVRRKSKGQLVREAISACYQSSFADLPLQQSQALAAYQGDTSVWASSLAKWECTS